MSDCEKKYTSKEEHGSTVSEGVHVPSLNEGTQLIKKQQQQQQQESLLDSVSDVGVVKVSSTSEKDTIESQAPTGGGRSNAFSELVRGWEAYMNNPHGQTFPSFQEGLARLTGPLIPKPLEGDLAAPALEGHPLAPPALRHTHSSPQCRSSMFNNENDDKVLPPIPLGAFVRSSSTPSSLRQGHTGSAFGPADGSAFTLPSQRASYTSVSDPGGVHHSAFDPVKYYARALEDMERTSIEVTADMRQQSSTDDVAQQSQEEQGRKGVASRAARFLSDVRVLRRRRRNRGGRENPAEPSSVSSSSKEADSSEEGAGLDTSVTVITESEPNPNEISMLSRSSEVSAILNEINDDEEKKFDQKYTASVSENDQEEGQEEAPPEVRQYQHLDSDLDLDEEDLHYQRIALQPESPRKEETPQEVKKYRQLDSDVEEETLHYQRIELQAESPGTIPSPSYQQMVDDRPPCIHEKPSKTKIQIQIPGDNKATTTTPAGEAISSPSPTGMIGEGSSVSRSNDSMVESPGTTRTSGTGTTSAGHTTQATFSSSNTGVQSLLSTISETDREVMEANKQGKRRRGLQTLKIRRKGDPEGGSENSSSTNSSNPHGYVALENSPVPLREGANVPAERFFMASPAADGSVTRTSSSSSRSQIPLATRRSAQSASTGTTSSATNTTSSRSSSSPPTFVSYLDRQQASDLTSLREAAETSSPRGGTDSGEEREASPAEMVGYPEVIFEEHKTPQEISSMHPNPIRASKVHRGRPGRFRSRPPRSPVKGMRPLTTPPPRGSVSPLVHQQSPPRNIVDHPTSSISRPHVMRTVVLSPAATGSAVGPKETIPSSLSSQLNEDQYPASCRGFLRGRTYEDGCIEILKTDSKDEMVAASSSNLVTPEKDHTTP